ncbi:uncharacterized protein [Miscanthus floridulus]|uniref:uncharacterized protein n=1 Tax=Miscanthus floridulus TaxID=154761 RepID=UPI00345B1158
MEPLAEENKKLKEAMNLLEKNIQRAQRERDLAESNAWDLEYQKGVLSRQLATAKEQLRSKSEQLITASTQLKDASEQLERLQKVSEEKREQDAVLGQLRQTLEQLREEKAKETERANKLIEELDSEYPVVGFSAEVNVFPDGTSKCMQTTIGGSRHNSMCWSKTLVPRGTNLTP